MSELRGHANHKSRDEPGRYSRSYTSSSTLGADLRRGRRRLSSTLQVPPWRPGERARSPDYDSMQRPTTLPLRIPPRISITHVDSDRSAIVRKPVYTAFSNQGGDVLRQLQPKVSQSITNYP
ncbi:3',5'-cyclic-AMP phosphodiesterase 4B-like isoform X2 [Pseudophryne corroboree]|uniref:3',5'-cyclic-AMP phosphodiesterase 4B-like isoform X2 n=1 Tax=Pseudophryne corroboree TaxID=495146 RepID=UPI003081D2F1